MAAGAAVGLEEVISMTFHASPPDLHPTGWGIAAAILGVVVVLVAIITIGP